jgi:hypothetical protein
MYSLQYRQVVYKIDICNEKSKTDVNGFKMQIIICIMCRDFWILYVWSDSSWHVKVD